MISDISVVQMSVFFWSGVLKMRMFWREKMPDTVLQFFPTENTVFKGIVHPKNADSFIIFLLFCGSKAE